MVLLEVGSSIYSIDVLPVKVENDIPIKNNWLKKFLHFGVLVAIPLDLKCIQNTPKIINIKD
jgi:hypothetical protein